MPVMSISKSGSLYRRWSMLFIDSAFLFDISQCNRLLSFCKVEVLAWVRSIITPSDLSVSTRARLAAQSCLSLIGNTLSLSVEVCYHRAMLDLTHIHTPVVTVWKLVGYLGIAMFAGRWVVQMLASRRAGRPVMTRAFWWMSLVGSLLCLSYFVFGKNDSVGIFSYLMPSGIALYNLLLDAKHRKNMVKDDVAEAL